MRYNPTTLATLLPFLVILCTVLVELFFVKGEEAVSMGTTILAAKFDGGVVLASDSRTSVSDYVSNRMASKINVLLDDAKVGGDSACVCRAGSAADTQHLIEKVRQDLYLRHYGQRAVKPSVRSAAYFIRYLLNKSQQKVSCSLICAGYDSSDQQGIIYSIAQSGALFDRSEEGGLTLGSGSVLVQAYLDDQYRSNMKQEDCVAMLARAIELAMARDGHSGGVATICVIDKNGCNFLTSPIRDSMSGKKSLRHQAQPKTFEIKNFADPIYKGKH